MNNKNEEIFNNEENLPEIEVYLSKRKLLLMILPSCIFIVISILMFINRTNYIQIISILSFILFGICFLVSALQLFKSRIPVFILNEKGLSYNILLRNKNIFIKWKEIEEIDYTNTFIYIYLIEESDLLKSKKNRSEPIVLYMSELGMKKDTFTYLIYYYFDKYKNLNLENNENS